MPSDACHRSALGLCNKLIVQAEESACSRPVGSGSGSREA